MRVISGILKSRKINGYDIEGTRPTMDKVKESLFAMIQNDIRDSICLDLFAGSGSLGIEAISNGAKLVYFIDHNRKVIDIIKENVNNFHIEDKSIVMLSDYQKALEKFKQENVKFDLIFLDPPYQAMMIPGILDYIDKNNLLRKNGQVICEYTNSNLEECYDTLKCIKHKKYSDKEIKIYIKD